MKQLFLFISLIASCLAYSTIIDIISDQERFSTLVSHLQRTELIPFINNLPRATFFAPDNIAFAKYPHAITRETLLYHLLPMPLITSDMRHGQLVESMYVRDGYLESGQRMKLTKKLFTIHYVNDAKMMDNDIFVNKETVIHVINRVLEPPKSLEDLLYSLDRKMYDLIKKAKVPLWMNNKPLTAFISKRYLLDRFKQIEQDYLISHYGLEELQMMLKYTIVSEPVYFDNIGRGETNYGTESGKVIKIKLNDCNEITVNGLRVLERDIIAANGVVHVLEDVPYTNSFVFDTRKYLIGVNATKFISLIDQYQLTSLISSNKTILAPLNEMMDEDDIPNNQKIQWLTYHIIQGAYPSENLYDMMLLKTLYNSSMLNNRPQRLVVHVDRNTREEKGLMNSAYSFNHQKVVGKEMSIDGNIIYRISKPLGLPLDIFSTLVVDLNLSTFIAAIYISNAADKIRSAKGITLFAPTNQAFRSLGLVSRYLFHPSGHRDLRKILEYHVALSPLYYQDLLHHGLQPVDTLLTNETRLINSTRQHVRFGSALVEASDLPVSNGVVHMVHTLQIPPTVQISHRRLLRGIEANLMEIVLTRTGLKDQIEGTDWLVLAPTDRAFEQLDLESLWNDTAQLTRLAKLHILPRKPKVLWGEHDTLLTSAANRVVLESTGSGTRMVRVLGQPPGMHAHVLDLGHLHQGGMVIEIDAVLWPVEDTSRARSLFAALFWIGLIGLVLTVAYVVFMRVSSARAGYQPILDREQPSVAEQEEAETAARMYQ
ncbi:hypothetical protein G6F55_005969 [Rhizopus delemar]|uniref:FAS1 domain-containing protein n=2 Tax=Rhizopus TaxID=4842 RepID=A0A9P7CV56_9FUNG|nr:hypothetical protein G6F55_005969 [Rhizopus delemar]KAG1552983.1 hypothetical protein G6F51_000890 [Rhizopus arrhizus]KAG1526579.1 hypothetical protein G6F52_002300 [Rhizopus delemar]KAG1555011.1 hypothetical protein G6F49_007533 [Rhizopus delemar]KAG1575990.1 hypothetical protein G6F50_000590 [Rhizopus delemar]